MSKYFQNINIRLDFAILISTLLLVLYGILVIYSSEFYPHNQFDQEQEGNLYIKQIIFLIPSLAVMIFLYFFNYQNLVKYIVPIYVIMLTLLIAVLLVGREVHGAKSWFGVGDFGIQPSEFSKIFFVIVLAGFLTKIGNKIQELKYFLISLVLMVIPAGLIFLEPDPGTVIVVACMYLSMIFLAGCKLRHFVTLISIGGLGIVIGIMAKLTPDRIADYLMPLYQIVSDELLILEIAGLALAFFLISYFITIKYKTKAIVYISLIFFILSIGTTSSFAVKYTLKPHHVKRLTTFLMKDVNLLDEGYQVQQSKIAIGSGQLTGQGWTKGEHNHSNLLRKGKTTDYIFSVLAEEFGFAGVVILFILYSIILYRGISIIYNSRDIMGALLTVGVVSMIGFHIFINLGTCTGVMPVIGIPLPFLSSGGSSLVSFLAGIGIILSVDTRKFQH